MKFQLKTLVAIAAIATAASSIAQVNPAQVQFEQNLKKLYPSTTFKNVRPTPVGGIFEVQMGENVTYVEESGRYFFFGRLFDMPQQNDLTAARMDEINKVDIDQLPLKDAIKLVKGNGSRTMVVFSDPDCPFCKQLESNLKSMTDVTIYTFLMPLTGLHPDAKRKAVNIWCSKDRVRAWENLMLNNQQAPDANCDNPIERTMALGNKLNVSGTPTMFAADGRKRSGAADGAFLTTWLDQGAKADAKVSQK